MRRTLLTSLALASLPFPAAAACPGLEDPMPARRAQAVMAFGRQKSAECLAKALGDPSPAVRTAAAQTLAGLGPASAPAVDALVRASKDPAAPVRRSVFQALSVVGASDPRVRGAFEAALKDEDAFIRRAAAQTLKLGPAAPSPAPPPPEPGMPTADPARAWFLRIISAGSPYAPCGPGMEALLDEPKETVEGVVRYISQPGIVAQNCALDILTRLGPAARSAAPALEQACRSASIPARLPHLRWALYRADPAAPGALTSLLYAGRHGVKAAEEELAALWPPPEQGLRLLAAGPDKETAEAASLQLGRISRASAEAKRLRKELGRWSLPIHPGKRRCESCSFMQCAFVSCFSRIDFRLDARKKAALDLLLLGTAGFVELSDAMVDGWPMVRFAVLEVLDPSQIGVRYPEEAGSERLLPGLTASLEDGSWEVRHRSASALARLGVKAAPALEALARALAREKDQAVIDSINRAVASIQASGQRSGRR
ncbi:MAG: HEAT repeat domain-containing protein [Elusimicrobia bacterium]|nr:HEAT repeat domain-containing protein [Elusimicrobiota bacterium]